MSWKAEVKVRLKDTVLDPQGEAVRSSLQTLGYPVDSVRVGRLLEVYVDCEEKDDAARYVQDFCSRVLANPVIEDFEIAIAAEAKP